MKVALWVSGAILFVILIQYPIQQSTDSLDSWSLPMAGQVIVLDAGAVCVDETLEKDITLNVTKKFVIICSIRLLLYI